MRRGGAILELHLNQMKGLTVQDKIEREIEIEAPWDRVWELVTETGWWVPDDGGVAGDRAPGATTIRQSEQHGAIPVQVVQLTPQTYAAYRWASTVAPAELTDTNTTLVEFHLDAVGDRIRVRVVESGFAALKVAQDAVQQGVADNSHGWELELTHLRDMAAGHAAT